MVKFKVLYERNGVVGNGHFGRSLALCEEIRRQGFEYVHLNIDEGTTPKHVGPTILDTASTNKTESYILENPNDFITTIEYYGNSVTPGLNINTFEQLQEERSHASFTGLEYVMIRREFSEHVPHFNDLESSSYILIMIGAREQKKIVFDLIDFIRIKFPGKRPVIILNKLAEEIQLDEDVLVYRNPDNLVSLMSNCYFAIVSAGVAFFELLHLGKPSFLIPLIPMHYRFCDEMISKNLSLGYINAFESGNPTKTIDREVIRIAQIGPRTIDGQGANRIIEKTLEYYGK